VILIGGGIIRSIKKNRLPKKTKASGNRRAPFLSFRNRVSCIGKKQPQAIRIESLWYIHNAGYKKNPSIGRKVRTGRGSQSSTLGTGEAQRGGSGTIKKRSGETQK
jgi:hypothetical protein